MKNLPLIAYAVVVLVSPADGSIHNIHAVRYFIVFSCVPVSILCDCAFAGSQASLAASALIVELHRRLGSKLKSKAAKIGAGFVDACLGHLRMSVARIRTLRAGLTVVDPVVGKPSDAASSGDSGVSGGGGGGGVAEGGGGREVRRLVEKKWGSVRNGSRNGSRHAR